MADLCAHCKRAIRVTGSLFVRNRLCRICYMNPDIRAAFPVPVVPDSVHPLPTPTRHLPGTEGKLDVMVNRFAAGEQLFHPDDNSPWIDQRDDDYDW